MMDGRPHPALITDEGLEDYVKLAETSISPPEEGEPAGEASFRTASATLTAGIMISDALNRVAHALVLLGNAGAILPGGTEMGAIEILSKEVHDGLDGLASAVSSLGTRAEYLLEDALRARRQESPEDR